MFQIWQFNLVGTTNDVFKRIKIKKFTSKLKIFIEKWNLTSQKSIT